MHARRADLGKVLGKLENTVGKLQDCRVHLLECRLILWQMLCRPDVWSAVCRKLLYECIICGGYIHERVSIE